ncbi:hypothetical protein [Pseudomonas aeruginosa]|uniref:hypothetical protein n=1 Tax=Pseudomonas aeruginosa TaxID=287 RepID=UPI000F5431C7|nr:hypothetical protein [Pseudomonas aeruginosa]EIU1413927.1 hypothetical protein [Pseudomonas aeruginosa]MCG9956520.1 hypothetical protein [Pseudomonas aeruginosa]MCS7968629.1 hypothetical protein [Pseudomonas aeruginosa]MCS8135138.1 hypothetical protein [Pseudomonas aeruginosa]MCS8177490.1 hypothetical protein [Pseudomonas aeruginosa]
MSSIKKHPLYPFFDIGLLGDFRLQDERLEGHFGDYPPTSWLVRVSGAAREYWAFFTEHEAISACERNLFDRPYFVAACLCRAVEDGDAEVAVRLASGLAYNEGRSVGRREMAVQLGHPEYLSVSDAEMLSLSFSNGEY